MMLFKLQLHIGWEGNTCCAPSTGEWIHWKQVSSSSRMFTTTTEQIVIVPQATSANMLAILSTNAISSKDNKGDSVLLWVILLECTCCAFVSVTINLICLGEKLLLR